MSVTNDYTQADVDALKSAIVSGVLRVDYSGPPARSVTYQSLDAMRALLAQIVAQTNDAAGTRRSFRVGIVKKGV
jgi:hypothetical protein